VPRRGFERGRITQALCVQLDFNDEGCQGWWPDAENPVLFEREGAECGDSVLLQRDLDSEAQALAG